MKKLKAILGIILPFILTGSYFIYYLNYKSAVASNKQISEYINHSRTLIFSNTKILRDTDIQYTHFFAIISYPKSKLAILIKPANITRYFAIEEYNNKQSIISLDTIENGVIAVTINEDEYNDPSFGTLQNPIPILYFKDIHNPQDVYVTDAQYHKNVQEYLTYDKKINSKKKGH